MNSLRTLLLLLAFTFTARSEQARSADSFVESIGVNTHLGYTDTVYRDYNTVIRPRLIELGVRHIRDGTWSSNILNRYLDLHTNGGVRVLLISNPKRAVAQAKALGSALWAIEGVNEPDTREGWVPVIRAEQQQLFAAIKGDSQTTKVPVLVSSLANIRNSPAQLGNMTEFLDYGNMHPYAAGQMPTKHWGWGLNGDKAIAEAKKVSTTKPIVVTECGYHNQENNKNHPGVSESAAGKYIPRLLLHYFNRGLVRSYLYEFADEKPDAEFKDMEQHFGLIRRDGSPKPTFTALKNLITVLKDPGAEFASGSLDFKLSGETNSIQHTFLQKRDGRFCLVLWNEIACYDLSAKKDVTNKVAKVKVQLPQDFTASLFQPNQSAVAVKTLARSKEFTLDVPDEVLILELTQ